MSLKLGERDAKKNSSYKIFILFLKLIVCSISFFFRFFWPALTFSEFFWTLNSCFLFIWLNVKFLFCHSRRRWFYFEIPWFWLFELFFTWCHRISNKFSIIFVLRDDECSAQFARFFDNFSALLISIRFKHFVFFFCKTLFV